MNNTSGVPPEPAPLTDEETRRIRTLLEQEARWSWLRSTLRTWALAVAAVVTGVTVGLDALRSIIRRLAE